MRVAAGVVWTRMSLRSPGAAATVTVPFGPYLSHHSV
jgi:hypothetical protein